MSLTFFLFFQDVPKFAVASLNEGHEGTADVIGLVDDDLFNFMLKMRNNGDFNNTGKRDDDRKREER